MAYLSYTSAKDIVVTIGGSKYFEGTLRFFTLNEPVLTNINTNLNATSGSINSSYIPSYTSNDSTAWLYATSEMLDLVNNILNGWYLYEQYLQYAEVNTVVWIYNKNNPGFRIGMRYKGLYTVNNHTGARVELGFSFAGTVTWDTVNLKYIWGYDNNNSKRSLYIGFVVDRNNAYACPIALQYVQPSTGRRDLTVGAWYSGSRTWYNSARYYFYGIFGDVVIPTDDPYPSDNYNQPIQGPGDFDDTSDVIDIPTTPGLTVSSSRLVTIYTPSAQQIEDLAERLIDPNILQALANTVEDISACIIGLHIIPLVVPYTVPDRQVCANFMGISLGLGVYLNKASNQFLDVDCGTLTANEYWGNCLDYSPYTRISIFLPFCGYYDIETDEVMGKEIQVKYRVDIASGSCIAFIIVNDSVLYQYTGNCSQQIPVTSVDFNSFLSNAFNVAVATATGGASVAAAGSAVMAADSAFGGSTGGTVEERSNMLEASVKHYDAVKMRAEGRIAGSAVNAVVNSKPHFNHGGSLTGSSGFLGCKKPYLIITRPNPMIPDGYGKFHGYPCNTTAILSNLSGYTEVADIRLNIPDATVDEIIECEKLLKDGVVL